MNSILYKKKFLYFTFFYLFTFQLLFLISHVSINFSQKNLTKFKKTIKKYLNTIIYFHINIHQRKSTQFCLYVDRYRGIAPNNYIFNIKYFVENTDKNVLNIFIKRMHIYIYISISKLIITVTSFKSLLYELIIFYPPLIIDRMNSRNNNCNILCGSKIFVKENCPFLPQMPNFFFFS